MSYSFLQGLSYAARVDVHTEISAASQPFSFLIVVSHEIQRAEGQKNDRKCEHVQKLMDYTANVQKKSGKTWISATKVTLINFTN